jgi:regulator of RNase E activity RraA
MADMVVEAFRRLDTTSVSDALDKLGLPGGLFGIKPVVEGRPICGRAFTVHYVPCGVVKGTVGDFLDDVNPGQVVVIDNMGRTDCTVWGDLMAVAAKRIGIEGTVIDGVCRDIPSVKSSGYAIYTKGYYMRTGKERVEVDKVNRPVAVSGVKVEPGDIILGDDSGVVVIPKVKEKELLKIAQEIDEKEQLVMDEVNKGISLKEARKKVNYHSLQTNEKAGSNV